MAYRRRRARRFRRRSRRARLPAAFARAELIPVNAGRIKPYIKPGDAWVKRQVCRYFFIPTGTNVQTFRWQDVWNAIAVGPSRSGESSVAQPFTFASRFDVKISSVRIYSQTAGLSFSLNVNESAIMQSESSSNFKTYVCHPSSAIQYARLGFKIPYPQRLLFATLSPTSNAAIFEIDIGTNVPAQSPFVVKISLKYKI